MKFASQVIVIFDPHGCFTKSPVVDNVRQIWSFDNPSEDIMII